MTPGVKQSRYGYVCPAGATQRPRKQFTGTLTWLTEESSMHVMKKKIPKNLVAYCTVSHT